jgi:hypothetical protein
VNLFADLINEGAHSVMGPFMALLGACGTVVGIVPGFGELIGYVLRLPSGCLSDRKGKYWAINIIRYLINMLAAPLLALAGSWEEAAMFIIAERMGKAM